MQTMDHQAMQHQMAENGLSGQTITGDHLMAGIPDWLYYLSIVIVMLLSFLIFNVVRHRPNKLENYFKLELTRFRPVKLMIKSRGVQLSVQLILVFLFLVILYAGLYGNQHSGRNIAPSLTWNIWWEGLIFIILFFGKMFCYACPWDALTSWLRKMSFLKVKDRELFNLGLPWPKHLKNIYPAIIFFIALTWIELGYRVTLSPEKTAILGLVMFGMAFIPGLIFEKKSFCRYGCLVGRVSGLYAMFVPVEIRNKNPDVCRSCKTVDCFRGNGTGYACPTGMNLKTMDSNTYCIMCAECFRSCKYDNVAVNVRPFAHDHAVAPRPRKDESYLALILFSLTAFHGFTMTPAWNTVVRALQSTFHLIEIGAFSIGMAVSIAIPIFVYNGFVYLSKIAAGDTTFSHKMLFIKYAYGVVPIALFYHVAHNIEHFITESQKLVVLVSDPFGYGWDLFGTAAMKTASLFSLETVWALQVVMIMTGHIFGIYVSHKQAHMMFKDRKTALKSQLPMIVMMVLFSVLSLWLIAQPMEMRTAL